MNATSDRSDVRGKPTVPKPEPLPLRIDRSPRLVFREGKWLRILPGAFQYHAWTEDIAKATAFPPALAAGWAGAVDGRAVAENGAAKVAEEWLLKELEPGWRAMYAHAYIRTDNTSSLASGWSTDNTIALALAAG